MSRKGENITKRKDGRWEARLIYAYDEDHRAKYRYLYGKTYAEAKAKKEHLQSSLIRCEASLPPNALTLGDVAAEFLIHKQTTVKSSTLAHYRQLLRAYVPHRMCKLRLQQMNAPLIERYALELLQNGGQQATGLAPKTVRDVLALLRSIFKYAIRRRYMVSDVLDFSIPCYVPPKVSVLTKEEQMALEHFSIECDDSFRLGLYITLYTGLRLGELCALKWSDIDLVSSELHVCRTIQRIPSYGMHKTEIIIGEPKTRTSTRTIPLPAKLVKLLSIHRMQVSDESAYLLTGQKKYIEPSNYYGRYRRWLKKLEIRPYSFHTLRHTFATRCIESGFDIKSLSEILGHTDVRITLNRYVHPSMDLKRRHMERMFDMLSQSGMQS